jgi:hypothetical protein
MVSLRGLTAEPFPEVVHAALTRRAVPGTLADGRTLSHPLLITLTV